MAFSRKARVFSDVVNARAAYKGLADKKQTRDNALMPLHEKYLNPFTDFGFKKLFGSEPNKELLIDFLNQLLPAHHQIQDLTYVRNELMGDTALDRGAVFDIYCISPGGERFIVEMQKAKQLYFKDRSVFYATWPIREQAQRGENWDFKLSAVYLVGILDFVFADDQADDEVCHRVQLKDQFDRVFYDKLMLSCFTNSAGRSG